MFTCIQCEESYTALTGDVDERTCYKCLDFEEDIETLSQLAQKGII